MVDSTEESKDFAIDCGSRDKFCHVQYSQKNWDGGFQLKFVAIPSIGLYYTICYVIFTTSYRAKSISMDALHG